MNNYEIDKLYTYICLEFKNYRTSDNVNKKQEEVAFDLNITASYLSKIENGKIKKLSLYYFMVLASYYGLTVEKIIENAKKGMKLDEEL